MKDGIIRADGASRRVRASFPETYTEFRRQAEEGTLLLDMMFNAAGWTQLPTFLSKGTLLTDQTEVALWGDAADRTVNQALRKLYSELQVPRILETYTSAGSYQWTVPTNGDYVIVIIGGGGSGGAVAGDTEGSVGATGGAAGQVNYYRGYLTAGTVIPLVVGGGGAAVTTSSSALSGNAGGASSFNGVAAEGGEGGHADRDGYAVGGALGGQPSCAHTNTSAIPMGGVTVVNSDSSGGASVAVGMPIPSIFLDADGLPISCLCAGGAYKQSAVRFLPNGKTMSAGKLEWDADVTAITPTDCGAGGGAAAGNTGYQVTSAAGADGGVFIYKVMGGDLE